jgi:hypothetical protein
MSNAGLADAVSALENIAAGVEPNRAELMSGALALNIFVKDREVSTDLLLAATSLSLHAHSGLFLSKACRSNAGRAAEAVRELLEE